MVSQERDCLLYLISPPALEPAAFADILRKTLAAAPGRIGAFLLRLDADETAVKQAASYLQPLCAEYGVAFMLEGHPELAAALDADGVHLADASSPVSAVRGLLGKGRMLGIACGTSRDLAMRVGNDGADYVAFTASDNAICDTLEWWQTFFILPCVAYDGVNPANCTQLVQAGADFLAIDDIWHDPATQVAAFDKAVTEALQTV
ncbi:MAG TPA: thiamine phosphate synthase [Xanthomonadales bacterium]|nr:thiamine phosphate synthase [Xanthomonadales bacterium]